MTAKIIKKDKHWESSRGWRRTSSTFRLNSGISSNNNTPLWARLNIDPTPMHVLPLRPELASDIFPDFSCIEIQMYGRQAEGCIRKIAVRNKLPQFEL
jgi:hypothetical protein